MHLSMKDGVVIIVICSIALRCKYKNTKYMCMRHPKQHASKQSCSNIQLSSKDDNISVGGQDMPELAKGS